MQALVTYYDANVGFITSDGAFIDYNPILLGQTLPFSTITRATVYRYLEEADFSLSVKTNNF